MLGSIGWDIWVKVWYKTFRNRGYDAFRVRGRGSF